ncbi:MAG: choice-of-anchor D domain-containing protein [Candidatus Solibacter sp.]|nr:choice-of-anchor D domain-containing protein [Candidatus Solibacter sp.]
MRSCRPTAACLLLALLLAPAASAQFDLFLVEGTAQRAAPPLYDFGSLYANESASAHFRVRNTSNAAATLNVLAVAGVGFTLVSPALPIGLAPQGAVDLSVVFRATDAGTYSASLNSEGIAILLAATVAPRLTYRVGTGAGTALTGAVDFGGVVRGSAGLRRITIQNDTPLLLLIPAVSVQGADFALLAPAPSGQVLEPHQGGEFTIAFTPRIAGVRQGSLVIGDRSYPLLGTGVDPPLPKPVVSLDLRQAASAQQGAVIIRFDAPAQTSGTGSVTLDFRGAADAAIAFASGGRGATFPIAPGDLQAVLPFQTGTTAGVLTFTAQIGGSIDQQSVTIAAASPGIATAQGVRSASALEIRITGFDNTRSLGALSFLFYDAAGNAIAPGAIRTDATADFARYFAASDLGGVFFLRAVFPVTGDAALVASCEVTLTNSAGSAKTQRTSF